MIIPLCYLLDTFLLSAVFLFVNLVSPLFPGRYDDRSGSSQRTSHWSAGDALGARASLEVLSVPAQLVIKGLHERDEGLYYCRVDFRKQPTKTTRVVLIVVGEDYVCLEVLSLHRQLTSTRAA